MIDCTVFTSWKTNNPNEVSGMRKLTANCKMHFSLREIISFHTVITITKTQGQISPGKHTSLCPPPASSKLFRQPKSSNNSHYFSLYCLPTVTQSACRNCVSFWTHEEFRLPEFIPPGAPGPAISNRVAWRQSGGCSTRSGEKAGVGKWAINKPINWPQLFSSTANQFFI